MKNALKTIRPDLLNIVSPPAIFEDDPVPKELDKEFYRDGRRWRVTARTDTFIIATAIDAVLDNHGEPSRDSDIIKVVL